MKVDSSYLHSIVLLGHVLVLLGSKEAGHILVIARRTPGKTPQRLVETTSACTFPMSSIVCSISTVTGFASASIWTRISSLVCHAMLQSQSACIYEQRDNLWLAGYLGR
jgi:hypothetical protein